MKLEVGMYVRIKNINNIIEINRLRSYRKDTNTFHLYNEKITAEAIANKSNIIKASHNLIDLIEVGDYVNGYKVTHNKNKYTLNNKEYPIIYTDEQEYFAGGWSNKRFDIEERNEIKSILTKEQFEANVYKVGGDK